MPGSRPSSGTSAASSAPAEKKGVTVYCGAQPLFEGGTRYEPGEAITGLSAARIKALGTMVTTKKP